MLKVKGTENIVEKKAIFYENCRKFFFNNKFLKQYNFNIIFPTLLNFTQTFEELGEFSDIINKEMFIFKDKKNRILALAPEHTINIAKFYKQKKINICYFSKTFRYQRPQKNVKREFIQLGCEWLNINDDYNTLLIFFNIISEFFNYIYEIYNIDNKNQITIKINYLNEKYFNFIKNIINRNKNNINKLCLICKKRYKKNYIKILDCNKCSLLFINNDFKNFYSDDIINKIIKNIKSKYFKIIYNFKLVRGLDYYNKLIFEFYNNNIKNNKSFLSGGFYKINNNNIFSNNFGFAIGIERFYNHINEIIN